MKILTLNAGLLSLRLFGKKLLEPAGFVEERKAALPFAIRSQDADVVLLQEVYSRNDKAWICAEMRSTYPYSYIHTQRRDLRLLQNSLVTLSKFPIASSAFTRFRAGRWDEYLIDTKGYSTCVLNETPLGRITLFNVHTTAGALTHPEAPKIDQVRMAQIEQLLLAATEASKLSEPLLVGDFNCGPGVSTHSTPLVDREIDSTLVKASERVSLGNYQRVLNGGYVDSFKESRSDELPTWDPVENFHNRDGDHASWGCPAQRIDHVFFRRGRFGCKGANTVFTEPIVATDHGHVPLSDHYGLLVELSAVG